jgi:hypothetical protein
MLNCETRRDVLVCGTCIRNFVVDSFKMKMKI